MANNRDVNLNLRVSATGQDALKSLKDEVKDLAKSGAVLGPAFDAAAKEIDALVDQADKVDALRDAERVLEGTAVAAEKTAAATADYRAKLAALDGPIGTANAALAASREKMDAAVAAHRALGVEIGLLSAGTDRAGKRTAEYQQRISELRIAKVNAAESARVLTAAYRDDEAVVKGLVREQSALEKSLAASEKATAKAAAAQRASVGALSDARSALTATGLAVQDHATAELALATAIAKVGNDINKAVQDKQALAAAAREAAREADRLADIEAQTTARLRAEATEQADVMRAGYAAMEAERKRLADRQVAIANAEEDRLNAIVAASVERQKAAAREQAAAWEASARDVAASQARAAEASKQAADKIDKALGTIGVTSVSDLRARIVATREALAHLGQTGTLTGAELAEASRQAGARIERLEAQIRSATGSMSLMDRASGIMSNGLARLGIAAAAVEGMRRLGVSAVEANMRLETMTLGLGAVYKDSTTVAQSIEFLRKTSDRAGMSFDAMSDGFLKYSASMESSNVPMETQRQLFERLINASGRLGMSTDNVNRAINALGQMAGKGVLSMEELRQQLGDVLPGATALAAEGMGMTQAELFKLVESGKLLSTDFFPALSTALTKLNGENETALGNWNRLKNGFTSSATAFGETTGMLEIMSNGMKALRVVLAAVMIPVSGLSAAFVSLVKGLAAVAAALTTMSTGPLRMWADGVNKANEGLIKHQDELGRALDAYNGVAPSVEPAVAAVESLTQKYGSAEAALAHLMATTGKQKLSQEQATQAWYLLQRAVVDTQKSSEVSIQTAERAAKATELEGRAMTELAKLSGDKVVAMRAEVTAAEQNVAAQANVVATREREIATLQAQRDKLAELIVSGSAEASAREASIASLDKEIETRQSALGQAEGELAVDEQRRHSAELNLKLSQDNVVSLEKLRVAHIATSEALSVMVDAQRQGMATAEAVTTARRAATDAEALYILALEQSAAAARAMSSVEQAGINVRIAQQNVALAAAQAEEKIHTAYGRTVEAERAVIKQKEIAIAIAKLRAEATEKEAAATKLAAEADLAELTASGEINEAKRLEIESRIKNAEAKLLEASASKENIKWLQEEIKLLRTRPAQKPTPAPTPGPNGAPAPGPNGAPAPGPNGAPAPGPNGAPAPAPKTPMTGDGLEANEDGSAKGTFTSFMSMGTAQSVAAGTSTDFATANAEIAAAQARFSEMGGAVSLRASADLAALALAVRQAEAKVQANARSQSRKSTGGSTPAPTPAPTPTPSSGVQVNINANELASRINVVGTQDAEKLRQVVIELLRQKGSAQ